MTLPGLAPSMLEPASLKELDLRQSPAEFADGVSLAPLEKSQARIEDAQRQLWASRSAGVLLVFHGLDASGKDSTLRRLTQAMDPMGVRVKGFGVPTEEEAAHDFLWRAWPHLPARGEVVIFNRSYYEAVFAERVLAGNSGQAADGVQIIDTLPLPICTYTRSQRDRCFKPDADYGYCAAKDLHYYGFKLGCF